MMKKTVIYTALLTAGLAMVGTSSAAITAGNNATGSFSTAASGSTTFSYTVQNASDVVVLGVYVDNSNSGLGSVTFNGVSATGGFGANSGNGSRLSMYYFANPTVGTADFSFTAAQPNQGSGGYIVWELSGVDLAAPVAMSAPQPSLNSSTTITTLNPNSFIIDMLGVNNGGFPSAPTSASILTKTAEVDMNGSFGGGYIASGAATVATAGLTQLGWTHPSGSQAGELAFAFSPSAVPEPSSYALTIAGLLCVGGMVRRRRSAEA